MASTDTVVHGVAPSNRLADVEGQLGSDSGDGSEGNRSTAQAKRRRFRPGRLRVLVGLTAVAGLLAGVIPLLERGSDGPDLKPPPPPPLPLLPHLDEFKY